MKKIKLFVGLAMVLASVRVYAQDSTKVLFHLPIEKISSIGLYVAPEFAYGQIKNQFTTIGGFSGMVLLNNKFGIGATVQHSLDRSFSPTGISPLYLHTAVGGLKMEYVCFEKSPIHFTYNLMLGGGMANADSATHYSNANGYTYEPHGHGDMHHKDRLGINSDFYIVQPGITVEANIFKYAKLFAGANYRFAIKGTDSNALLPVSTLQGLSASVGLKIGLFEHEIHKKVTQ